MSDERRIRVRGEELGAIDLEDLYEMAMSGEIDHTAEFWSLRQKRWCPLAGIIEDLETSVTASKALAQMSEAGITRAKIVGSGTGDDCPACRALAGVYPIDQVPTPPPADCTCVPWCRCLVQAVL